MPSVRRKHLYKFYTIIIFNIHKNVALNRLTIFEHKCYTVFAFMNLLFFATDGQTGLPVGSKKHIQFCRPSGQFERVCFFKLPFLVKSHICGVAGRYCFVF